jgi:membrane fusion protein (multidrug efflux system)
MTEDAMLKHIVAWLAVVVAIAGISAGLGFYKYSELKAAKAAAEASPEPAEAIATATARAGEWTPTTRAIGTVVATRELELRNELAGTIAELAFTSGSIVEAGQMLVQFDVRQETANLAAAQAEARLAKATLDRRQGLRNSAAFSEQEFDKAREDLAAATARAENLQVIIDKKRIAAPFKARIGITNLQPGAYLDIGTRIATLQGVDADAYVDFALPQDNAASIGPGTTVSLSSPAIASGTADAKIIAEDDSVDRANRTVRFRAVASGLGDTFRPGMFVDVTAATSKPQATVLVPLVAVRRSPQGQHVFVLASEDGKMRARQRNVTTGPVIDDDVAVQSGLAAGDLIAASGSFKLRDGALVQPESAGAAPDAAAPVGTN